MSLFSTGRDGLGSFSEAVLSLTREKLEGSHATSTFGTASLGLFTPVETTHLGGRVRARSTLTTSDVEGVLATTTAQNVSLVGALTER